MVDFRREILLDRILQVPRALAAGALRRHDQQGLRIAVNMAGCSNRDLFLELHKTPLLLQLNSPSVYRPSARREGLYGEFSSMALWGYTEESPEKLAWSILLESNHFYFRVRGHCMQLEMPPCGFPELKFVMSTAGADWEMQYGSVDKAPLHLSHPGVIAVDNKRKVMSDILKGVTLRVNRLKNPVKDPVSEFEAVTELKLLEHEYKNMRHAMTNQSKGRVLQRINELKSYLLGYEDEQV